MHSVPVAPEPYDADLREYRREQAISALAARYTPNKLTPLTTRVARKRNSRPLFEPEDDELPQDGGQAGQQGRERRGLGLLELRLAPEAMRWRSRSVREQDAGEGEGTHIAIWPGSRG